MGRPFVRTALFAAALGLCLSGCGRSMDKAVSEEMEAYQASAEAAGAQNLKAGQDYLAKVAKEPGVVTLPSGLMYRLVSRTDVNGAQPTINDAVTIDYEGKLIDGHVFDSSFARGAPATFPLGRLIEAWKIAIPLMHKGDEIILYTPPNLGYGAQDGGEIPPNSVLIFRIRLIDIKK